MRYIWLSSQNPYHNLAAEEWLLTHHKSDIFMLWQNRPSVIIGRHQNTLAEIDIEYVTKNKIDVVRRLTGGGAVFHDPGNLNFTFIKNVENNEKEIDFRKYTQPIINALQSLGVPAAFSGRNDLTIEGKKFSGNAMLFYKNRVLEHGTLLYSTQKSMLTDALRADPTKFADKAVKSIRNRVTNISDHLSEPLSVLQFKDYLMQFVMQQSGNQSIESLTNAEEAQISRLVTEKYSTWEWNFGKSPQYTYRRSVRTKGGSVQLEMVVKNGIIEEARFFGDFFSPKNIELLEKQLVGVLHERENMVQWLHAVDAVSYFSSVEWEELEGLF